MICNPSLTRHEPCGSLILAEYRTARLHNAYSPWNIRFYRVSEHIHVSKRHGKSGFGVIENVTSGLLAAYLPP
jgi:hypothetical protein